MALVEVNWRPSTKQLRLFAFLLLVLAGMIAWAMGARSQVSTLRMIVPAVLALISILGMMMPKWIWPVYVVWMAAVLPIGWVMSHVVMGLVFYFVVTPIGLVMRLVGRDPMERRFEKDVSSYWKARPERSETSRYFRQY